MSIKTVIQEVKKDAILLDQKYHIRENIILLGVTTAWTSATVLVGAAVSKYQLQSGAEPTFYANGAMEKELRNMKPGETFILPSNAKGIPDLIVKVKP